MGEKDNERAHLSGHSRPGAHAASLGSADDRLRRAELRKNVRRLEAEHNYRSRTTGEKQADDEREARRNAKLSGNSSKVPAGVHSSTTSSADDRARRKEERHGSRSDGPPESRTKQGAVPPKVPMQTASLDPVDESFAVEATAVNEDDANERVRKLEEQLASIVQNGGVTANAPLVVAATAAPANYNDGDSDEDTEFEYERTFFQKYRCGIVFALLLAIGGGVAGYLLGKGSEPSTAVRVYQKPNEATCKKVLDEIVYTDYTVFVDLTFEITLVKPVTESKIQQTLDSLTTAVDKRFIPLLVGCPISSTRRRLISVNLRYMVADAEIKPAQQVNDNPDSFFAKVATVLYLKGSESALTAGELLRDVFIYENGAETLALPSDIVSGISLEQVTTSDTPPFRPPSPTAAPVNILDATARRELLQELLIGFGPINAEALDWVSDVDTWQPAADDRTASQQWIDRYALVVFYFATNGNMWTDSTGWLDTSRSVCGWNGIDDHCSNGVVDNFWLQNAGVTGTFPSEIGLLSALTLLRMGENRVGGQIPTEVGNLSNLRDLILSANSLSGTIPTEVARLTRLTYLSLWDNNNLGGTIPALPPSMAKFYVSNCNLVGPLPRIGQLTNLVHFEVNDNNLTGSLPEDVDLAPRIELLDIYNNRNIGGSIPTTIGKLTALTKLVAYSMSLTGTIPTEIGLLTNLWNLELEKNPLLSGTIPTEIGLLTALTDFGVYETRVGGSIPSEIGRATSLVYLVFWECQFTGKIPSEIINLRSLEEFYVDGNQLSGDVPPLPSSLSECALQGNCFSDVSNVPRTCEIDPNCP